jgi:hypothetical protein
MTARLALRDVCVTIHSLNCSSKTPPAVDMLRQVYLADASKPKWDCSDNGASGLTRFIWQVILPHQIMHLGNGYKRCVESCWYGQRFYRNPIWDHWDSTRDIRHAFQSSSYSRSHPNIRRYLETLYASYSQTCTCDSALTRRLDWHRAANVSIRNVRLNMLPNLSSSSE